MIKYYPIGTVVTLINGNTPLMIYGRKQIQGDTDTLWDYVGCLYPQGNLGDEYNIFFQNEEIEAVYHMGLMSEAEEEIEKLLHKDIKQ